MLGCDVLGLRRHRVAVFCDGGGIYNGPVWPQAQRQAAAKLRMIYFLVNSKVLITTSDLPECSIISVSRTKSEKIEKVSDVAKACVKMRALF